jgi:hypothetical protein
MARTTFSGPVRSNAGYNSGGALNASDLSTGPLNQINFTVRPVATYTGTVAALVGAVNQRTAGVSGGNIFGCYAQTSFSNNATSTITGLNTAVYGVVACGSSASIGPAPGEVLVFGRVQEQEPRHPLRLLASVKNPLLRTHA